MRRLLRCCLFASLVWSLPVLSAYPEKPIRIVVGFTPGGTADSVARILAASLGPRLSGSVVVETRAGANGNLATEHVARAAPDGHTLFFTSIGHVVNPVLYRDANYDPVGGFSPIGQVLSAPNILVVPASSAFNSVRDLVAFAKANPGRLDVASSGSCTSVHLSAELFKQLAAVELTHIPYKGTGSALPDLLSGTVAMMFPNLPSALPLVQAGKLKALGVTTAKRSESAPTIPTIAEAGIPGYDMSTWYGLIGPPRMPADLVGRLNRELRAVLAEPAVRDKLHAQGADVVTGSAEDFARFIQDESARWSRLIRQAKVRVE